MRKILFVLLCLVSANGFSQVAFELGAIKIDSIYFRGTSNWTDSLVTNAKLPSASDQQIPSAKAVKEFVVDTVAQMISDSISALTFTSTALSDSIDKHTDTLQLHNTRLKVMELIDHTHSNKATLDATTAAYTTTINSTITNHTQYIADLNDSVARHTDTLQVHDTRLKALENGGGGGTGDVNVSGATEANNIAYWNGTDSTLVSNDVVKLYADSAVFTEPVWVHDSIVFNDSTYFKVFGNVGSSGDVWLTLTSTNALDTAATEPAWQGLAMDLPPLDEYFKDQQLVNGHWELKIYYIDNATKELKCQYGWAGLGMMETQSAYAIFHERTMRYLVLQDSAIKQSKRSVMKRKVKDLELRLDTIEQRLNQPMNQPLYHVKPNRK